MYTQLRYQKLLDNVVEEIKKLSKLKGGEYAGDADRLANFRRNGDRMGVPMELIWGIYASKHWDAIMQFVNDIAHGKNRVRMESLESRANDLIVYLILFLAILDERNNEAAQGQAQSNLYPNFQNSVKKDPNE